MALPLELGFRLSFDATDSKGRFAGMADPAFRLLRSLTPNSLCCWRRYPACLSSGLVDLGDGLRLFHACNGLGPAHQHSRLGGLDGAPDGNGQCDSGHAFIVWYVADKDEVVVAEAVPPTNKFSPDGFARRAAYGLNAVLRILELGG